MIPAPFGLTVTRLRGTPIIDPYSGEATGTDWSNPSRLDFIGCPVWQESSMEPGADMASGSPIPRAQVVTVHKAALPHGADVLSTDRFEIGGKPYEMVGDPDDSVSPFTGWAPGCVITGRRTDG